MPVRLAAVVLVVLCACPRPTWGQAALPRLVVGDADLTSQASPEIQDDVLLLAVNLVARAFGAAVSWDAAAHAATVTGVSGTAVRLTAGLVRAQVDGAARDLPAAPILRDGILWVPGVALLRMLGAYVAVEDDGRTQHALAQVTGVSWRAGGGGLAVRVMATGPVQVDARVLHQPERVVLDVNGAVSRLAAPAQDIGVAGVARVRGGQFHVRPYVTRIVFDLDHAAAFTVAAHPGAVVLAIGDLRPGPAAAASAGPSTVTAVAPSTASAPPAAPSAGGAAAPPAAPRTGEPGSPTGPPSGPPPDASRMAPEPLAMPPLPDFDDHPGAFHVQAVTYDDQGRAGSITIQASQRLTYALHQFVYPDRLAIDVSGGVYLARRHDIEIGSEAVRNIVVSQFALKPNLTRVLVHLHRKVPYTAALTNGGRTLTVTLGNPGRRLARGSAVIVDAGHGGADGGAVGPSGLREADVTLAIARFVRDALAAQGIPAAMTRTDDTTVPLEERPDLAQRDGGILFVSIHANASRSIGPAGTETYYESPESEALARIVQAEVVQALGEPDRGVRTADFYVLANAPMPAVLVETLFITNPSEEAMLRDPAVQRRLAGAIARAIAAYVQASAGRAP